MCCPCHRLLSVLFSLLVRHFFVGGQLRHQNIVTIDTVPSSFTNDNIVMYSGILPFLNPTGDHTAASVLCAISPLVIFSTISKDGPISMSDLEVSCTEPPTSAPTKKSGGDSKGSGKSGGATMSGTHMVLLPVSILVAMTLQMVAFF